MALRQKDADRFEDIEAMRQTNAEQAAVLEITQHKLAIANLRVEQNQGSAAAVPAEGQSLIGSGLLEVTTQLGLELVTTSNVGKYDDQIGGTLGAKRWVIC
jgi:hypothetical protein